MNEPGSARITSGPLEGMTLSEVRKASLPVTLDIDAKTYLMAQLVSQKTNLTTDDVLQRWIAIGAMHDVLKQPIPAVAELDGIDVINDLRRQASQ